MSIRFGIINQSGANCWTGVEFLCMSHFKFYSITTHFTLTIKWKHHNKHGTRRTCPIYFDWRAVCVVLYNVWAIINFQFAFPVLPAWIYCRLVRRDVYYTSVIKRVRLLYQIEPPLVENWSHKTDKDLCKELHISSQHKKWRKPNLTLRNDRLTMETKIIHRTAPGRKE